MKFFPGRRLFGAAVLAAALAGCGGGGGDEEVPSAASSSAGAPSSFLGKKLVQTVQQSVGTGSIAVGRTITYNFVDAQTVRGEGLATKLTDQWKYELTAPNQAKVTLTYPNGESVDTLTFTSATGGTYRSDIKFFASGQTNSNSGTFTISNI
jgi:hypothetical protein